MKTCHEHRGVTVQYDDYHAGCPLCSVVTRTREAASEAGLHCAPGGEEGGLCVDAESVQSILDGVE